MTDSSLADDEEALARYAADLAMQIHAALARWVTRSVRRVADQQHIALDDAAAASVVQVADACACEVGARVETLLAHDIDDQLTSPLQVLRGAVSYATEVLASLGARPVPRDRFAVEAFPDDVYALTPASFAEIDPALREPGLLWGAAKAHVHLQRRKRSA